MQSWFLLSLAIIFEVAGTTAMKLSAGFTNFWPSVFLFAFYAAAFISLTLALKRIDLSMAYAIWAGIGTLLITFIGFYFFRETMTMVKVASLTCIIVGIVGLHLAT